MIRLRDNVFNVTRSFVIFRYPISHNTIDKKKGILYIIDI